MSKSFQALTNRGRALRLRRLALDALEQYSLRVTRLGLITNEFNGIFRVDTRSGQRYVVREMLPEGGHGVDSIKAEMTWLDAPRTCAQR